MKVKELIQKLSEFDQNLEVTISDGYGFHFYHTKKLVMAPIELDNDRTVLDMGVGACSTERLDNDEDDQTGS